MKRTRIFFQIAALTGALILSACSESTDHSADAPVPHEQAHEQTKQVASAVRSELFSLYPSRGLTVMDERRMQDYVAFLEKAYETPFTEPLNGLTMEQAFEKVSEALEISVWFHQPSLADKGMTPESKVENVGPYRTAYEALQMLSEALGSHEYEHSNVDYSYVNGGLIVGRRYWIAHHTRVSLIYSISTLIINDAELWNIQRLINEYILSQRPQKEGEQTGLFFMDSRGPFPGMPHIYQHMQQLIEKRKIDINELMMDSVGHPLMWGARGGDMASARMIGGNLILNASLKYQVAVAEFLASFDDASIKDVNDMRALYERFKDAK